MRLGLSTIKKIVEYSSSTVLLSEISAGMWLQQFYFEIF